MEIQDDRNEAQRGTHRFLVVGTDKFMSGWGKAHGGRSLAAWACTSAELGRCERQIRGRKDMSRVRVVSAGNYRPAGPGHLHVYVFNGQNFDGGEA